MSVTILTASVPHRAQMLAEAIQSVNDQNVAPAAHLIRVDHERKGAAYTYNRLADAVQTEWMTFLDDDDILGIEHLETLMESARAKPHVDIHYAGCVSNGFNFTNYNEPFNRDVLLTQRCLIPITALIRTDVFHDCGGFPDARSYDWAMWRNAVRGGAQVRQVMKTTWTYRYHGENHSFRQERPA